jgi:NitT/TauT family transport system ATP-binding protein
VLSCRDVSKKFPTPDGGEKVALQGASFEMSDGEFVSLVGPSGCGKTTLMRLCAGLLSPTSGVVDYQGTNAAVPKGTYGMVFQAASLLEWRTVVDNILLPTEILGLDMEAARQRAGELLAKMGLDGTQDLLPKQLSGGMQQRVSICRSLVHDPNVLFMDEPFGALDAMTREELNMELQSIHMEQHKSVLFVTHSISEAIVLSDRVLVLAANPGRIVADLRVDLDRPRTSAMFGDPEFARLSKEIRGLIFGSKA